MIQHKTTYNIRLDADDIQTIITALSNSAEDMERREQYLKTTSSPEIYRRLLESARDYRRCADKIAAQMRKP